MTDDSKSLNGGSHEDDFDVNDLARRIERLTNRYGARKDLNDLADMITNMHRTLVQSFAGGFILRFVKKMADNYREGKYDDRDKKTAVLCDEMWNAIEDKYNLGDGEEICLPMI